MMITYICDQKCECKNSPGCIQNGGECSHTTDIKHSKNFDEVPIVEGHESFTKYNLPDREVKYIEEEK